MQVDPKERPNIKRDKNFVLFSGTKVLQYTEDRNASIRTPDGGCLAVDLRTGFETSQGNTELPSGDFLTGLPRIPAVIPYPAGSRICKGSEKIHNKTVKHFVFTQNSARDQCCSV